MPQKRIVIDRARWSGARPLPTMLAIAGDSASGKTTLTKGLVEALGPDRITAVCIDEYHRYDRVERRGMPITPLHPDCNYIEIIEQHLQLLARGEPILKPVYDHATGTFGRPELIEPREFVIVEGLLPLYSRLMRACFDVTVFLDLPEEIRRGWKVRRDRDQRGYTEREVLAELERRERESEMFIRPQRNHADVVVRFAPIAERGESVHDPLSATLLLRPTIDHPDLARAVNEDTRSAIHLKLLRDSGKPVDALHIHAYAAGALATKVQEAIWGSLGVAEPMPDSLGRLDSNTRLEPLAVTQLILLYHLVQTRRRQGMEAAVS